LTKLVFGFAHSRGDGPRFLPRTFPRGLEGGDALLLVRKAAIAVSRASRSSARSSVV
jgi:hypothetical protein